MSIFIAEKWNFLTVRKFHSMLCPGTSISYTSDFWTSIIKLN